MKPGDLVRLVRHAPSYYLNGFRNSIGVVVSQPWNNFGPARRLEVAFGGRTVSIHPSWLEVISERR